MSETHLSFVKGLFLGVVQAGRLRPFPRQEPDERETCRMLLDTYREFCLEHVDGARFDREHAVPVEVRRGLAELGILGLTIPEEHGGADLGMTTYCRVMEETNRHCGSTAVVLGGHQSIGIKALLLHGTQEQAAAWLPKLATGEWMAAYALSEPQAGSDPASLETTAVPDGDGYALSGQKIWCTNGGFADFISVFARVPERGITCFVLTPEQMGEGFTRGAEEDKLGLRGSSTTQLFLDGVKVPRENVLGPVGKGLRVALEVLNYGRTSLAAGCVGASKAILEQAAAHARDRVQFGRPIADFELIQAKLAEMTLDTHATESIAYLTAGMTDRGDPDFSLEAAACKVFGTEAHWRTCNHAVQVAGGIAYVEEYPYERFLRDARINMIFEGTNEILHHFIALAGLRAPREALAAAGAAPSDLATGAAILRQHAAELGALGGEQGDPFSDPPAELASEVALLEASVTLMGESVAQALTEHGDEIEERQLVQERLAAAAIDLYVGFACASRAEMAIEERGAAGAAEEVTVAREAITRATVRARARLHELAAADDQGVRRVSAITRAHESWPFGLVP